MGFKKTSDTIAISFGLVESAPNTFTQEEIALQLDVLNNEIFVVLGIDLDVTNPEAIAATDTASRASVTSTEATIVQSLQDTNCLASARESIRAAGFVDGGVSFQRAAETTIPSLVDYIGLIATNNFFVQCESLNATQVMGVTGRLWGYRAKADATTYAALVQSEVLSS